MALALPAFPELDDIVKSGDLRKQVDVIRKISDLFAQGSAQFHPRHVEVFDGILIGLLPLVEIGERALLAEKLAPIPNAPPALIGLLVRDDEISIAGPLLRSSPLVDEPVLIEIASAKGQGHLFAISERAVLSPTITDVIVQRGDRDVIRSVAANSGACFSLDGFSGLIRRSSDDGTLAIVVGKRHDINPQQLKDLLERSADIVRRRLLEVVTPERKSAINQALIRIDAASGSGSIARLQPDAPKPGDAGGVTEADLLALADQHKYDETIAALSVMTGISLTIIEHLLKGDRHDPILIMGKSLGLHWPTVRALITVRAGPGRPNPSNLEMDEARMNFERLVPATAQRVLSFWQKRPAAEAHRN